MPEGKKGELIMAITIVQVSNQSVTRQRRLICMIKAGAR